MPLLLLRISHGKMLGRVARDSRIRLFGLEVPCRTMAVFEIDYLLAL